MPRGCGMMLIVVGSLSVCLSACLSVRRSCCEPRAVAFAVSKGGSRLVCVCVCVRVCRRSSRTATSKRCSSVKADKVPCPLAGPAPAHRQGPGAKQKEGYIFGRSSWWGSALAKGRGVDEACYERILPYITHACSTHSGHTHLDKPPFLPPPSCSLPSRPPTGFVCISSPPTCHPST